MPHISAGGASTSDAGGFDPLVDIATRPPAMAIAQPDVVGSRGVDSPLPLGRPVVLQDTGWTGALSPSEGMLAFRDITDCAEAVRAIEEDYEKHSRAAQALASTVFSPLGVLKPLLEKIL